MCVVPVTSGKLAPYENEVIEPRSQGLAFQKIHAMFNIDELRRALALILSYKKTNARKSCGYTNYSK